MGTESVISPEIRDGSKYNVTIVSIGNVAIVRAGTLHTFVDFIDSNCYTNR